MSSFSILDWSAWSPALADRDAWRSWARDPKVPIGDGAPEVRFVPAMQRRRFSRLARMAMQVAHDTCPPETMRESGLVFASRHGEVHASVAMMRGIAVDEPLSPTAFSHSVHNAPAGQLSIQVGHRAPASSVAAQRRTFSAGLIEALALSHRRGGTRVLLVFADEPMPTEFRAFTDEAEVSHALALLLAIDAPTDAPRLRIESGSRCENQTRELPEALDFLGWWLGNGREWNSVGNAPHWRIVREP